MGDEDKEFDYLSPSLGKTAALKDAGGNPAPKNKTIPEKQAPEVVAAPEVAAAPGAPAAQEDDDFGYLSSKKPVPPDYSQLIADAKRDANMWAGGELGAVAGAAGPIIRGIGSLAKQQGVDILGSALERFPGLTGNFGGNTIMGGLPAGGNTAMAGVPTGGAAPMGDQTPGGKWGEKTGYGIGSGSVQDTSSRYKRAASKGKIAKRLDTLYGVKLPGEPDSLIDRMIARSKAAEAAQEAARQAAETAQETARQTAIANEPSFGKEVVSTGKNVGNWLGSTGYGVLHGLNLANQLQEALDVGDRYKAEMIGHLISAAGSTADLASNFMPEIWRHGVRQYVSPLAMIGAGGADVAKGYHEMRDPRQPNESQAGYEKRTNTGAVRMPSAVVQAALGTVSPLGGFAMMAPALSPTYAMAHPEQARRWAEMGMYDDPTLAQAGFPTGLSLAFPAQYPRKIGAGRGVLNPTN